MANDGTVTFAVWLDADDAEKELTSIKKKILDLRTQLSEQTQVKSGLEATMEKAQIAADEAIQRLKELKDEYAQLSALKPSDAGYAQAQQRLPELTQDIKQQEALVKELVKDYNNAAAAVEKQNAAISKTTASLSAQESKYGIVQKMALTTKKATSAAAQTGAQAARDAGDATNALGERLERLGNRIAGLVKRVLFFSLITRALRALRDYIGNALKTSDEFTAAIARLKGALATAFQPILSAAIPAIVSLINFLAQAAAAVASFISLLFGTTVQSSAAAAQGLNEEADALNAVGGGAAKAEKQLASFDEINKLTNNQSGGGGGVSTNNKVDYSAIDEGTFLGGRLKRLIDELDFSRIKESFSTLTESVSKLADTIGQGLRWAWDNILVPLAHWTIEELAPAAIELLAKAFDFLRTVLEKLAPILQPFWEKVLKPVLKWSGRAIIKVLEDFTDLLDDLIKLLNGDISWKEFVNGLNGVQVALLALGGVAVLNAIGKLTTAVSGIPGAISAVIPKLKTSLATMAKTAATGALAVFDGVMLAYDVAKLTEAANTYNEAQLTHNKETERALNTYAQIYEEKGKEAADAWAKMAYDIDTTNASFDEAQAMIAQKIDGYWEGIPQNMWDGFKQGWDYYFGENGVGLWQLFKDAFNNVIQWLKDLLGIHSPSTVFYGIGTDIVQGLLNGFKAKWDDFISSIHRWWDDLVTWWDGLTLQTITGNVNATVNTAVKDALDYIDSVVASNSNGTYGGIYGVAYNDIPHLAQGAVIPPNREFLAVLGDQSAGANIEAPLDTMVAAFQAAMQGSAGDRTIILQVGEYEFGRLVYNAFNKESQRIGVANVTGGAFL